MIAHRCILDGAKHVGLQFLQQALIVSTHARHLHHFVDSVRNAQHNAAHLATLIKRQLVVAFHIGGQHTFQAVERVNGIRRMAVELRRLRCASFRSRY